MLGGGGTTGGAFMPVEFHAWALLATWLCGIPVVVLMACAIAAAYRNGVTDGYGYAKEPNCPGYRAAGDYLKATMAHRWPELREENNGG